MEIQIDLTAKTNDEWKDVLSEKLAEAETFEIHCWKQEQEAIDVALQFGTAKDAQWKGGVIIEGTVTEEFKEKLLSLPKPEEDFYPKMTPFFSIFLNTGFSSEHYGAELYQA